MSVIAFSVSAAEALAQLGASDMMAIAGAAALSQKDGQHRAGLKVSATRLLSVYDAGIRRRTVSQRRKQEHEPHGGPRPSGQGAASAGGMGMDSGPTRRVGSRARGSMTATTAGRCELARVS